MARILQKTEAQHMQQLQLDNTFWQFALTLYGKPGVAEKLLKLQDDYGLDINLILYMLWLGKEGIALNKAALHSIVTEASNWQQNIMQPLRSARREIKKRLGDGSHYQKAKALELAIEQEIIARLYAQTPNIAKHAECVDANLEAYLKAVNTKNLPEIRSLMDFYK